MKCHVLPTRRKEIGGAVLVTSKLSFGHLGVQNTCFERKEEKRFLEQVRPDPASRKKSEGTHSE